MQDSPVWSTQNELINSPDDILRRLIIVEDQLRFINQTQQQYSPQGRTRTNRTVPTSSSDVNQYDKLYDEIPTSTGWYKLVAVTNTNVLQWVIVTVNTF